jgi:two-component system, sensor histidine kinase and response regulator
METILVVEDDINVRENLGQLLTLEGYTVLTAIDGQNALEIIDSTKAIDLIISDIKMPNLTGHELLEKLQENDATKLIPLIFLSAKTNNEDIRTGMNIGADDYVTKPYSAEEILNTIKARLKKLNAQQTELSNLKENIIKYVPHELRTPLVSILGFSNLMLDELDSLSLSDFKYMLQTIKTSGLRLSEWVEKFIFYTEVETNSQSYKNNHQDEKNICELKDVIWEDNFSNNRAWMERKDDIRIELEDVLLRMNKGYLEFLIKELIENSAKFSEPGTSIKVTGIINGEYYEIAFYDEGIGFSDTCIEKITAFQQFERENKQQYGNGLGLAIVNKILCASNGEFDLKSKKNKFTTLTVKIPLAC